MSTMRSNRWKRKSTTWPGSQPIRCARVSRLICGCCRCCSGESHSLTQPLASEKPAYTLVPVGLHTSATHAERNEAVQTCGGWRIASPVLPGEDCGITHSSQNLAMIRNQQALIRLDETARRSCRPS